MKEVTEELLNFYASRTPKIYVSSQYFTILLYLLFYRYFTGLYFTAVPDVTGGTTLTPMDVVAGVLCLTP